jgi:hypothetical protein
MTAGQCAGLASAALGAAGTITLFFGSYSLQPFEGGVFGSDRLTALNRQTRAKNARRIIRQRIGLVLLCLSFFGQAVAIFV